MVKGTVRNLTNYGAFIEIEEGIDGLLHVSDMSLDPQDRPSQRGGREGPGGRVQGALASTRSAGGSPWASSSSTTIRGRPTSPSRYQPGQVVKGKVTKITNFGVFVELEDGLEGLLHISELADHKVENPEDVVKVGDEIEVKILRVDTDERKIGLSRKRVEWAEDDRERRAKPPMAAARRTPRAASSSRAASARRLRPAVQAGRDQRRARKNRQMRHKPTVEPLRLTIGSAGTTRKAIVT